VQYGPASTVDRSATTRPARGPAEALDVINGERSPTGRVRNDVGVTTAYARPVIVPRPLLRIGWAIHKRLFAISGGQIGGSPPSGNRIGTLFLETTGRRSGEPRRNGLYYLDDGPNLVVIASNAGADRDPGWWLNLQARPDAVARLGPRSRPVRARRSTPDEHARLWPRLIERHPAFAEYERATGREIAVVILEPR
jgi:F420H(2)-dependent quinone reductase